MGEIVNKQKLSKILGYTERTLTEWQKEGMPIEKTGTRGQSNTYDTEKVIAWLVKRATDTDGEMDRAKLRLTLAQARNAELDADQKEGSLISLDDMKALWGNVLAAFRARILSLPSRLTPQIAGLRDPKKIDKIMKDSLHEALNELAEYDPASNTKSKTGRKGSSKGGGGSTAT